MPPCPDPSSSPAPPERRPGDSSSASRRSPRTIPRPPRTSPAPSCDPDLPTYRAPRKAFSVIDLPTLYSGKVRDVYDAGDGRLLLVASDRISAFDVVTA